MTSEELKLVARHFFEEVWNQGSPTAIEELSARSDSSRADSISALIRMVSDLGSRHPSITNIRSSSGSVCPSGVLTSFSNLRVSQRVPGRTLHGERPDCGRR